MFFVCLFLWYIRQFFFQHEQNISLENKVTYSNCLFNSGKRVNILFQKHFHGKAVNFLFLKIFIVIIIIIIISFFILFFNFFTLRLQYTFRAASLTNDVARPV